MSVNTLPEGSEVNNAEGFTKVPSNVLNTTESKSQDIPRQEETSVNPQEEGIPQEEGRMEEKLQRSSQLLPSTGNSCSPRQTHFGVDKTPQTRMLSISRLFKGRKSDADEAVALFPPVRFDVTKINKRGKTQKRKLGLSSKGILNIRPNSKTSSREPWSDVTICYKIDEFTVAIKYTKAERVYRSDSKQHADDIFNSLRERINAHQEKERKELRMKMIEGFDEKDKYEAVPVLQKEEAANENEAALRECVEDILLSKKSELFKLKDRICGFHITDFSKVKELRKYLDQFKYKIFEDKREKLLDLMEKSDSEANKFVLYVIESVIENACVPVHIDEIYKWLNEKVNVKASDDVFKKVQLLNDKKQDFFGIDKNLDSKNDWSNAVLELVNFPKKVLPSEKMQCLLNTARHIHHEAKQTCDKKEITGDDLLPIVIFVLVKASEKNKKIIISAADELFVQILINPEALQGERGYYLCVFSAALEFVRNYDRKKIEERFNTIRRLRDFGFF